MIEDLNPMDRRLAVFSAVLAVALLGLAVAGAHYGRQSASAILPLILYLFTACVITIVAWTDAKRGYAAPSEGAILLVALPWALALESVFMLPSALVPSFIALYGNYLGSLASVVSVVFVISGLALLGNTIKRRFAPHWNRPTRAELLSEVEAQILTWNLTAGDAAKRGSLLERIRPHAAKRPMVAAAAEQDRT